MVRQKTMVVVFGWRQQVTEQVFLIATVNEPLAVKTQGT